MKATKNNQEGQVISIYSTQLILYGTPPPQNHNDDDSFQRIYSIQLPTYQNVQQVGNLIPTIEHKIRKIYPQKSKNVPKIFSGALRKYINLNFQDIIPENDDLKEFLKLSSKQKSGDSIQNIMGKQKLEEFLKTSIGKQISQQFFGNYQWGTYTIKANKSDVDQLCRFNHIYINQQS